MGVLGSRAAAVGWVVHRGSDCGTLMPRSPEHRVLFSTAAVRIVYCFAIRTCILASTECASTSRSELDELVNVGRHYMHMILLIDLITLFVMA